MKPMSYNNIGTRVIFVIRNICDVLPKSGDFEVSHLCLSPSNTYLLIMLFSKSMQKYQLKLFKNNNNDLIELTNVRDNEQNDIKFDNGLFMTNTFEFIINTQGKLIFYKMEKQIKYKITQVIDQQQFYIKNMALSPDDQSLYTCGHYFLLWKKIQQSSRKSNWQIVLKIYTHRIFYNISVSESYILVNLEGTLLIKKRIRIKNWMFNQKIQIKKNSISYVKIFEDNLILADEWIIQWNKQTQKIIRKYKFTSKNDVDQIINYSNGLIFCKGKNSRITCYKYSNGQLIKQQTFSDFDPKCFEVSRQSDIIYTVIVQGIQSKKLALFQKQQ